MPSTRFSVAGAGSCFLGYLSSLPLFSWRTSPVPSLVRRFCKRSSSALACCSSSARAVFACCISACFSFNCWLLKKFEQHHERQTFVSSGKLEQCPVGRGDGGVMPFGFINPCAFAIHAQQPAVILPEKFHKFQPVTTEESKTVRIINKIEIGTFHKDVQYLAYLVSPSFEKRCDIVCFCGYGLSDFVELSAIPGQRSEKSFTACMICPCRAVSR